MSNLLSQASLVMIPSGYKEDVVYSQIPTSGAGDLSFTRASNGTRVNSAGLVEVAPWNMVTYSNDFSSSWALIEASKSTGVTDPIGNANAIKLKYTTATSAHYITQGITLTGSNAHSVYAKAGELQFLQIASAQSIDEYANFNLSTGVIGTYGSRASNVQIESVGNGWYRCSVVFTNGSNGIYLAIVQSASSDWFGVATYAGANSTNGLYLYGGQLNAGTLKPYFPTTDRLNVPRLTYQNGGGGCPSLLLEKQSTNLITYSEQFDNASWGQYTTGSGAVNIIANAAISPDGTQNADEIQLTRSTLISDALLYQQQFVGNATYSRTIYLKAARSQDIGKSIQIWSYNGTVVQDSLSVVLTANWQRYDAGTATGALVEILSFGYLSSNTFPTTSGTDVRFYAWGAQGEASSYATSYIPTTSSSATRVADVYSRSLSSIASGTAYVNITDNVALGTPGTHVYGPFAITSASLGLYLSRPNNQRLRLWTAAANNVFQTTQTNLKLAITWDGTNVNVYQNGVKVVTSYAYALTNVNNLFSSTNIESSATIAEIALFNSVLTDAECISLTS